MLPPAPVLPLILQELRTAPGPACAQLQAAVSLAVTLEVVLPGEGLVAERALEGPGPTVEGQVVFEVVRV